MSFRQFSSCLLLVFALSGWLVGSPTAEAASESHGSAAAEHGEGHEGGDPNPLSVDPDLAIWTVVVFVVLFLVLSKFAWPAISAALVEREKRIEGNIAEAAVKHEQAKKLLLEHEAKLASAADEVRALLEEARRDAEHTKNQIVAEAKQAADQERDRALRDVERATDAAKKTLAETSANLAVELAGQVVRVNISPEQQSQLVRDALGRLSSMSPSKN
ncbi:F0F1 ATP synthase subunit B [Bythopirellula polymerisocia]|uniref:ATP synthase subunit b n=1 Tax=Bythopirellula polymerisocia TaxID=2528003 RepID=A0A5C6CS65_9BACT|nr:F0F1 ATP synthase subunit B [Bythopirellula polymerisocia]TWU27352.1 ATP synthase subunit b [Bythopirellula polymerisocia]